MGRKSQICTCLYVEDIELIKRNNWKYNDLIKLGLLSKTENPQLIKRLNETQLDLKHLIAKVRVMGLTLSQKDQKIEELEALFNQINEKNEKKGKK